MKILPGVVLVSALAASVVGLADAQSHMHGAPAAAAPAAVATVDSLPLYDGLGPHGRVVPGLSPLGQRYFDQGMRLAFAFGHGTAVRSFKAAIARDSTCAICWWGVAWARGPYINNPTPDSTALVEAVAAIEQAQRLSSGATPADRALIEAMSTRYAKVPTKANRAPLDSAYARAMADVVRRFPRDDDIGALLGEARMMLRPWKLYTRTKALEPGTAEALSALSTVLARNLRHPGACHLYIHATEAGPTPAVAEPCAELLGAGMPGASHMVHMASHTWHRVGRWGDAVRANQQAIIADERGRAGGAPGVYPMHNVRMLLGGATMDGQRAVSLDAVRLLEQSAPGDAALEMAVLARFGRWRELRAMQTRSGDRVTVAWSSVALGLALLDSGAARRADDQLTIVDALLASTPDTAGVDDVTDREWIALARGVLAGELLASRGQVDSAVVVLERAVAVEDGMVYQEHDTWPIPPRHVLAGVLLDAGRAAAAEQVLRVDLERHPRNGWALLGLQQSLTMQQRFAEAGAIEGQLGIALQRADVWIPGPRFRPAGARTRTDLSTGR